MQWSHFCSRNKREHSIVLRPLRGAVVHASGHSAAHHSERDGYVEAIDAPSEVANLCGAHGLTVVVRSSSMTDRRVTVRQTHLVLRAGEAKRAGLSVNAVAADPPWEPGLPDQRLLSFG